MPRRAAILVALLLGAGCESSSIGTSGPDANVIIGFVDARPADARVNCSTALECPTGMVCNPSTLRCATVSCTTHSQCGKQGFCNSGTCAQNALRGPCDTDDNCVGQESCQAGHCGCDGEALTATAVAPNMIIALDRSNSMVTNTVPGTNGDSRWEVAIRALKSLATRFQNGIRMGIFAWPGNLLDCEGNNDMTNCRGAHEGVMLGIGNGPAIGNFLDAVTTCNLGTPIGATLMRLVGYAPLGDTTRDNYVVLVTDGDENCGGNGPAQATALRNRAPSVRTFVIGFGGDVDAAVLNAIAMNGGTARPSAPFYYQADNEAALIAAFDEIAGAIGTCTFTLSGNADSPDRVFVFLGTMQIARDPTHRMGWDYEVGPKRLTFYGPTCDLVRSGGGGALSVSFACPIVP